MAIVCQDIAQLDELYGKPTRITTVSGSQIKLFIQINDLDTSDFVSEMLGETTQVYKTPVMRPGQGVFAPRVWTPHYTPRPLRSPLELREMSARLSILMVKNSPSFELTKIRHYKDKPYRRLYEVAKGAPPELPKLRLWQDDALGGALGPPTENPIAASAEPDEPVIAPTKRRATKKIAAKRSALRTTKPATAPASSPPATIATSPAPAPKAPKSLSLGPPPAQVGESCDLRLVLASAAAEQADASREMLSVLSGGKVSSDRVVEASATLKRLERAFGDDAAAR
jgi:type IV secretion system protein VirD4